MTRKKVPLQFIASDSSRKVTFKKRKKGLMKKVSELSTLCGIEACAVVYGPFSNEPEVWPSAAEARRTIARFRNISEMDRSKGMVNQQGFLRQRIAKAEGQLKKQQRENREKEVTEVMYQSLVGSPSTLLGLNLSDLNELDCMVGKTLHEIEERVRSLHKTPSLPPPPPPSRDNDSFRSHQGSSAVVESMSRVSVPENIQIEGGQGGSNNFENNNINNNNNNNVVVTTESGQQQQQQPSPWYMELLKPSDQTMFGGFTNKNEEVMNNMMMPFMSSSTMPVSSNWPNFLYP